MTSTITDEDVTELQTVLLDFLERSSGPHRVREVMETNTGIDYDLWHRMTNELGLPGLAVPESDGGAGYDFSIQLAVFEELGRSLACVPYLSTVGLAIPALLASGDADIQADTLPGLMAGTKTATVALTEPVFDRPAPERCLDAGPLPDPETASLSGQKRFVLDGCTADFILVMAGGEGGAGLYLVEGTAPGLTRTAMRTLDPTRRVATLDFRDVPARVVHTRDPGLPLEHARNVANAAIAAEQLGGAQRSLDMAVQYAKVREQFGRPVGSFQAIKHRCADMLVAVESARSAVDHLARTLARQPDDLPVAVALAKAYCSEAYLYVAKENIHIHGGMGFSWEHDAHLFFRRAQSSALLHGDSSHQRAVLADLLGF